MTVNLIQHNMFLQSPNVKTELSYDENIIHLFLILGLNRYKKKVYKKTKNLLTGVTEQDEEYQKVFKMPNFFTLLTPIILES